MPDCYCHDIWRILKQVNLYMKSKLERSLIERSMNSLTFLIVFLSFYPLVIATMANEYKKLSHDIPNQLSILKLIIYIASIEFQQIR